MPGPGERLERDRIVFRDQFLKTASLGMGIIGFVFGVLFLFIGYPEFAPFALIGGVNSGICYALVTRGRWQLAAYDFLAGCVFVILGFKLFGDSDVIEGVAQDTILVCIVVLAFMGGRRLAFTATAMGIAGSMIDSIVDYMAGMDAGLALVQGAGESSFMIMACIVAVLFDQRNKRTQQELTERLEQISDIDEEIERASLIASGDLRVRLSGRNAVSDLLQTIVGGLRGIIGEVRSGLTVVSSASAQLASGAKARRETVSAQAAAVEETRQTATKLAEASYEIARQATQVDGSIVTTTQHTGRAVSEMSTLQDSTAELETLLGVIKDVATKSEVLALNAALEGVRAGRAGRGFTVIAGNMQEMAESVQDSARDAERVVREVQVATAAAALAIEEAAKQAGQTAELARQITVITREQRASTSHIVDAMADMHRIAATMAAEAEEGLQSAHRLESIAQRIDGEAARFKL